MSIVTKLAPLFAPNAHAIRYFEEKRGKWNYRKIGRPLDEAALTQHISRGNPEFSLGAYVLRDLENSTGHALIFDFDDHDGDSAQLIRDTAIKFSTILDDLGLPYLLFRSGGGKGFHFYLLFQEPQTKSWLRAAGKFLLCEKLGFKDGTNGVKAGEVEIFPKGDHFGGQNVIALPMARKSVALRREGDVFVEALEPADLTFCPVLPDISDPGYGRSLSPTDHRRDFLAALLEYADCSAYGIPSFDPETKASCWQKVEEPLTLEVASTTEHVVGGYFPIDAATEKSRILVIRTSSPEAVASALQNTRHFVVSSHVPGFYYVWCVYAKARRKDQLQKIGRDAAAKATDSKALSMVGGVSPIPLPMTGGSQFVRRFDGNIPVFGPAPATVPVNTDRQPGPKKRAENRDHAFERLSGSLDPSDHEDWVNCGHMLIASFGKDDPWAFERWSEWSATAANADPLDALQLKWDKLDAHPRYSLASFWLTAKQAGYDGAMPFGKAVERKHRCVDLVSGVELFRSQEEVSFATIGPRQHVEVRTRAFEQFLRLQTYDTAGELLSAEDLKAVVETVDAQCQKGGKRIPIHLRIAREGAKGYLCLGDDARTVIEYDADGFRECAEPPVRFRVAPGAKPLPLPVAGKIEDLRALFNLDDENWVLLLSWLVMTLVHPGRPTPICVLNGEHGSAKTTALKQIVSILDPKVGATAGPPKNEDDLIASAYSSQVVSFDNVSSFHTLSDPLCRLATGGGLRKRQLFSDNTVPAAGVRTATAR